eukprot:jgi/Mesvir1/7149/Mv02509-RA.1
MTTPSPAMAAGVDKRRRGSADPEEMYDEDGAMEASRNTGKAVEASGSKKSSMRGSRKVERPQPEYAEVQGSVARSSLFQQDKDPSLPVMKEPVRVVVRFRPLSRTEWDAPKAGAGGSSNHSGRCVRVGANGTTVTCDDVAQSSFTFDKVFDSDAATSETKQATQVGFFNQVLDPYVADVLRGINCHAVVYGETGAGKTYTVHGPPATWSQGASTQEPMLKRAGLLPRFVVALFDAIEVDVARWQSKRRPGPQYMVKVSCVQAFGTQIVDLLDPSGGPDASTTDGTPADGDSSQNKNRSRGKELRVMSSHTRGICVAGATEVKVADAGKLLQVLADARARHESGREQGASPDPAQGGPAHPDRASAIFTIMVKRVGADGSVLAGKLCMTDLAGSEHREVAATHSGARKPMDEEATRVNKSVSCLGTVVYQLATHKPADQVPYGESSITELLQEGFGGNAKTVVIICCSASSLRETETLSSLRFGNRAQQVTNLVQANALIPKGMLSRENGHAGPRDGDAADGSQLFLFPVSFEPHRAKSARRSRTPDPAPSSEASSEGDDGAPRRRAVEAPARYRMNASSSFDSRTQRSAPNSRARGRHVAGSASQLAAHDEDSEGEEGGEEGRRFPRDGRAGGGGQGRAGGRMHGSLTNVDLSHASTAEVHSSRRLRAADRDDRVAPASSRSHAQGALPGSGHQHPQQGNLGSRHLNMVVPPMRIHSGASMHQLLPAPGDACPVCAGPLEQEDMQFHPCTCGFRPCLFCFDRIMQSLDAKCPSCRLPYGLPGSVIAAAAAAAAGGPSVAVAPASIMREYEVERILDKHTQQGINYYLIKWRGFPEEESTWEPEANVVDRQLIAEYEQEAAAALLQRKVAYSASNSTVLYGPNATSEMEANRVRSGFGGTTIVGGTVGRGMTKQAMTAQGTLDRNRRVLTVKRNMPSTLTAPYRISLVFRLAALVAFLYYRITNPNRDAVGLWITSVICEIWFAWAWLLDQLPKVNPVYRITYPERLSASYTDEELPYVDMVITTADPSKEPPIVTANVALSCMAADYPAIRLAVYVTDDGGSKFVFDTLAETARFARIWVPFCKINKVEPRCPEMYFNPPKLAAKGAKPEDPTKEAALSPKQKEEFDARRSLVQTAYEKFKSRIAALENAWRTDPDYNLNWPGRVRSDHDPIAHIFCKPEKADIELGPEQVMPFLVYISREKRPGFEHHKKAGSANSAVRASALITNGQFLMNLDCDHYINSSIAIREALCYFLDPVSGDDVGYVQFPQRFNAVDKHDRYANHNTVFYEAAMKGLDGIQGPYYIGTGCMFRRKALYGACPPGKEPPKSRSFCCFGSRSDKHTEARAAMADMHAAPAHSRAIDVVAPSTLVGMPSTRQMGPPTSSHRFGLSRTLAQSIVRDGANIIAPIEDMAPVSPKAILEEVALAISCDYEDKSDWGREIGWLYGSVTEDVVTGFLLHTRGWRSVYANPAKSAFIGTAPINLTDRLHQLLRWSTGSVEIFFSRFNPFIGRLCSHLKLLQRISYMNVAFYPFTGIILVVYTMLPAIALMTRKFIMPEVDLIAVAYYIAFFVTIFASSLLELRWSGVTIDAWWRTEQFWIIAGISSHVAGVVQGLLKALAGVEIAFKLTAKDNDKEDELAELYEVRFTWLLVPPAVIMCINLLSIIAGIANEIDGGDWALLGGKIVFAAWVIVHMYPFAKGLMGRRNRPPTIVLIWMLLLVVVFAGTWVLVVVKP